MWTDEGVKQVLQTRYCVLLYQSTSQSVSRHYKQLVRYRYRSRHRFMLPLL